VRVPELRLVRARVAPVLRWHRGALDRLYPIARLRRLSPAQRDALLLHELAHARRCDPWVRLLELTAGCLFWWHPLVYWARRSLRRAEEAACDASVLRWLPGRGRDYAQGLLATVEFLAGPRPRLPALASGAGAFHRLQERLTMIVNDRTPRRLARPLCWTLALAAGVALLVFPVGVARERDMPPELRAQTEELAHEMAQIEERRHVLQQRMSELHAAASSADLESQASALREAGRAAHAHLLETKSRLLERQAELEMLQHRLAAEHRDAELSAAKEELARAAAELDRQRQNLREAQVGLVPGLIRKQIEREQAQAVKQKIEGLIDALLDENLEGAERAAVGRELRRALAEVERSVSGAEVY
jgi:hypothetical protein